jgi:hypothetical protein
MHIAVDTLATLYITALVTWAAIIAWAFVTRQSFIQFLVIGLLVTWLARITWNRFPRTAVIASIVVNGAFLLLLVADAVQRRVATRGK